jgi:hypothetical protein
VSRHHSRWRLLLGVDYVYDYYYYADYYVEYAEELLAEYYTLYADLATEMITELNAIESEINQMNETLSSIDSSLQEINSTIQQGAEATQEAIAQLETAAQSAQTNAQEYRPGTGYDLCLQTDQQGRVGAISNVQPNSIPTDQIAALQVHSLLLMQMMRWATTTRAMLMSLAQLGASTK